jgi:anthranilate 1,2-dioxygenase small subunit
VEQAAAEKLIEGLIYDYAHCIDDDELENWPDFFIEDCFYKVISREDHARDMPAGVMTCTSRGMLIDRIASLRKANIYEPHVYRHLISAIRIRGQEDGLWNVQTSYAVIRILEEGDVSIFSTGKYLDKIIIKDGTARFKERICVFDSRRVDTLMVIPI